MKIDFNCDLGEGESLARTRALMRCITSANVACGGHAGDVESMENCALLGRKFDVFLGAHPGSLNRKGFGRGIVTVSAGELELLLLCQVSAFERLLRRHRLRLHHIKLHGGLYHVAEEDDTSARAYVRTVARYWPGVRLYVRCAGRVARNAFDANVPVSEEVYLDRAYLDNGALVPRSKPNALIIDPRAVACRVRRVISTGEIETLSGRTLNLQPKTLCMHVDTPNSVKLARTVAFVLRQAR